MPPLAAQLSPRYDFAPAPAFPRYCTSLLNRASDFYWETRLGIDTAGQAPSPHPDAHHYGTLAYWTYFAIFDRLRIGPEDVVLDLGSGKGRVVCIAATYPIKEAIGVEIDPELSVAGEANAARMRLRRSPITCVAQSALDYNYDAVTVIMLANPFGADTMRCFLGIVEDSVRRNPRTLRLVYCNPVIGTLLAAESWLQLYECWQPPTWSRLKFPVHFYRSASESEKKS